MRYFDLGEVVRFICYLEGQGLVPPDISADVYFKQSISAIKINSLKMYYLDIMETIDIEKWPEIYQHMTTTLRRKFERLPPTIRKS